MSASQFCCFPPFLLARIDDASDRPVPPSPVQLSSRIVVLLTVLLLILREQVSPRWRTISTKSTYSYRSSCKTRPDLKIASRRFLKQWQTTKITGIEQIVCSSWLAFSARVAALEAGAASASSVSGSARQDLGIYLDKPTGPRRGPMAQDHVTTTGTQDADLILSLVQTMEILEVPFYCSFRVNTLRWSIC